LITGDITRDEDQKQLRDTVYSVWGKVNLLFNNAGVKKPPAPLIHPISGDSRWSKPAVHGCHTAYFSA
jgi:NADP-dependent 3-hydroxy acid dehydrogenase YdfG